MTTATMTPAPSAMEARRDLTTEIQAHAAALASQAPALTPERISAVVSVIQAGGGAR